MGEIFLLDVAQDISSGEDLADNYLAALLDEVKKGVGSPGNKVHRVRRIDEFLYFQR